MNIKNFKNQLVVKNYKELCALLDEPIKGGKSKTLQLKNWERYFKYHKDGIKFVIDEIYNEVKEKIDMRGKTPNNRNNVLYIEYIEKLILDLLMQDSIKEKLCLSKSKLLKSLKMINSNYYFCKIRIPKLSQFTNIERNTIDEFYSSVDATLINNLERALNNLKSQSLILWTNEISVHKLSPMNYDDIDKIVKYDEYDEETVKYKVNSFASCIFREGTDDEKKFIIHTETEVMKNMGFNNKRDVIKRGKWNEFKDAVQKITLKELHIDYYYNSYKILFNQDHISEKYKELCKRLLTKEEKELNQYELNKAIKQRLQGNCKNRYERAATGTKNCIGNVDNEILKRRSNKKYIDDNNMLINTLIDANGNDIRNKIKKTKIKV